MLTVSSAWQARIPTWTLYLFPIGPYPVHMQPLSRQYWCASHTTEESGSHDCGSKNCIPTAADEWDTWICRLLGEIWFAATKEQWGFGSSSNLFVTAGVLLSRLQSDPDLRDVTLLILDEVHERDVFTDIALLIARNLLVRRPISGLCSCPPRHVYHEE